MKQQSQPIDKISDKPDMRGRPGRLAPDDASKITRRITLIALLVGIIFAVGKFIVWKQSHSVGILSSLVHSSLDLFAALSSFIAVRYAARPPDQTYRYGRGKAESFSAVLQVCLIIFAAFHLFEEAYERFINPEPIIETGAALLVMILFIGMTTWLLIAQSWAIRATGSIAVRGDRAHYIADMLANIIVIIGIVISTSTSFQRADALVGLIMALWLLWTAYKVAQLAWAQLMDQELPQPERDLIKEITLKDPMIRDVHDLRTRASGPHVHIQLRVDLEPSLSLSDAHDVVLKAEQRLMSAYGAGDILIHPHPLGCTQSHGNVRFRTDD